MWIMLIEKLPTNPSPPKLSIHWSTPWPMDNDAVIFQFRRVFGADFMPRVLGIFAAKKNMYYRENEKGEKIILNQEDVSKIVISFMEQQSDIFPDKVWGPGYQEHNNATCRKISYKGEHIRVFASEFTKMTAENMRIHCGGSLDDVTHELVPGDISSEKIITDIAAGILREFYDAALLDGCSHAQAQLVAMGVDVDIDGGNGEELASEKEFPPIGWYRCKPEYAEVYCYPNEMEE